MNFEAAALMRAATKQITFFLADVGGISQLNPEKLTAIERRLGTLMEQVQGVARSTEPGSLQKSDDEDVRQYRDQLDRLRNFMLELQAYAESRRTQILSNTRQVSDALEWCRALKLIK